MSVSLFQYLVDVLGKRPIPGIPSHRYFSVDKFPFTTRYDTSPSRHCCLVTLHHCLLIAGINLSNPPPTSHLNRLAQGHSPVRTTRWRASLHPSRLSQNTLAIRTPHLTRDAGVDWRTGPKPAATAVPACPPRVQLGNTSAAVRWPSPGLPARRCLAISYLDRTT